MTRFILVDGKQVGAVHALDRGLQFGDGLFETMAVVDGRIRLLPRHLARLRNDAGRLALELPDQLSLTTELVQAADRLAHGVLKLIVTRGSGGRGYRLPSHPVSRHIVIASDWPQLPQQLRLTVCETRLAAGGSLAGIKHLNRLEQIMACAEWQQRKNVDEGLMLDPDSHVIEATSANIFIVRGDTVLTPALNRCGVRGIMRDELVELTRASGRSCEASAIELADVMAADEVFLTNSISGIRPVIALDDRTWETGPVTQSLARDLQSKLSTALGREID